MMGMRLSQQRYVTNPQEDLDQWRDRMSRKFDLSPVPKSPDLLRSIQNMGLSKAMVHRYSWLVTMVTTGWL